MIRLLSIFGVFFLTMTLRSQSQETQGLVNEIRVKDTVLITIHGEPKISGPFIVSLGQQISHPLLGSIAVGGLNENTLADDLTKRLADGYILKPQVSVSVISQEPFTITVVGEVKTPGQIQYEPNKQLELASVIGLVGNLTAEADGSLIELKRGNRTIPTPIPGAEEMVMENGDLVSVPKLKPLGTFSISGEVKNTGNFVIPRTGKLTLFAAINLAGGPTQSAKLSKTLVSRREEGKIKTYRVDPSDRNQTFYVMPNDEIELKPRIF